MEGFSSELLKAIEERFGKRVATILLGLFCVAFVVAAVALIINYGVLPVTKFLRDAFEASLTKQEAIEFAGRALISAAVLALLCAASWLALQWLGRRFMRKVGEEVERAKRNVTSLKESAKQEFDVMRERSRALVEKSQENLERSRRIMRKMKKAVQVAKHVDELRAIFEDEDFGAEDGQEEM